MHILRFLQRKKAENLLSYLRHSNFVAEAKPSAKEGAKKSIRQLQTLPSLAIKKKKKTSRNSGQIWRDLNETATARVLGIIVR